MTKTYWIGMLSLLVGMGLSSRVAAQTNPTMAPAPEMDSTELEQPSASPMSAPASTVEDEEAAPLMQTQPNGFSGMSNQTPSGAIAEPMTPAGTMAQPTFSEDETLTPAEPLAQPAEPLVQPRQPVAQPAEPEAQPRPRVAQVGRRARVGTARNYIGVGGNLGFGEETSLGQGSFTVFGKIGIIPQIAVRPSVFFADEDATFLVPVTYNFVPRSTEVARVYPYIGGGIGFVAADDDDNVGPVITGGLEIPIAPRLTGNTAINVGFFDDADVGLTVGVGYNF